MWAGFTGIDSLGLDAGITDFSPGCGSMSVDPDRVAALEARYGSGFASREVEFAAAEDEHEAMYDRGWSDGLPLVPPTPERVARMLEGTTRDRHDVVAPSHRTWSSAPSRRSPSTRSWPAASPSTCR